MTDDRQLLEAAGMPCGRCDVGIYSESACTTPLAYRMASADDMGGLIPQCKRFNRQCVGAQDFADAIRADRPGWEEVAGSVRSLEHAMALSRAILALAARKQGGRG